MRRFFKHAFSHKTSDVTIIGSGIIGTSIAYELTKKGYNVTVLDKNKNVGDGPTSYSSGICRTYYSVFESMKLAHEGYQYWKNWNDYVCIKDYDLTPKFRECGAIILKNKNSNSFINNMVNNMQILNIPHVHLDQKETNKLVNKIGWDIDKCYHPLRIDDDNFGIPDDDIKMEGSIYMPDAGYVSDPRLATQNIYTAAKAIGCRFEFGEEVVDIRQANGRVTGVLLKSGKFLESPIVVNAAGCYSNIINKMAFPDKKNTVPNDMTLTTKPMRQEVAYVPFPSDIDYYSNGLITIDFDLGIYSRPEIGNKILIGGSEPDCDPKEFIKDISELNTNLTDNWDNYVYRAALRIPNLPVPMGKGVQGIVSTYDVTEDWTPIYDKSSLDGYYMAIGTSGSQFKNAGAVGKLMSRLINTNENIDINLDNPKYNILHNLDYTGNILNVRSFSRIRNPYVSSNNVLG